CKGPYKAEDEENHDHHHHTLYTGNAGTGYFDSAANMLDTQRDHEHPIGSMKASGAFARAMNNSGIIFTRTASQMVNADDASKFDELKTFEFAPPYDETTTFDRLLRKIDAMRWADPIGAANKLLEIDMERLPFDLYETYRSIAQDLSAQLETNYDLSAQTLLWDLGNSLRDMEQEFTGLFGEDPDTKLMELLGGSSMESLSDDIDNAMRAGGDDNGLPKNAGIVTKMATLAYALHERDRLEALPEGQYNPDAAAIEERRHAEAEYAPPAPTLQ
ncbi:MAG: hypothetical protein KDI11_02885, partial [Alphaproteobacteria bacterium]|nr:hypothetical protein [Alphaproteobacteria bacterium]